MNLPQYVQDCIDALESRGFSAYAVGGCVRDSLLGLTPHDYDLCTNALPDQIQQAFPDHSLVLAGKKHGTIGVVTPEGVVEITTFREEGGYRDSRHPDWVKFVSGVESDLARRDFTVNAMAYSPTRGFVDSFGGCRDLENRILRCVGEPRKRFTEDALRILRGVRFSVRFRLTPDAETEKAMTGMAPNMDTLARERVLDELCKLLPLVTAGDLLHYAPILAAAIPELAPMIGFDQHSPHHAYDLFTHTAYVTAALPPDLTLRWAGLLHDIGKIPTFTRDETGRGHFYGHAQVGADMAREVLGRLKAPNALRDQAVLLIRSHMTRLEPDKRLLRRRVGALGWDTLAKLLCLQEADMGSKGTGKPENADQFSRLRQLLAEIRAEEACLTVKDLAVDGYDLMALGLKGPALGRCLSRLLEQVQDETLPNTREALLAALGQTQLY